MENSHPVRVALVCMGDKFTLEDLMLQKQKLSDYSKYDNCIGEPISIRNAMNNSEVQRLVEYQPDSLIIEVDNENEAIEYLVYIHKVVRPVQITFVPRYSDILVNLASKLYPYARIYYMPYGLDNLPFSNDAILICDTHSSHLEKNSATLN